MKFIKNAIKTKLIFFTVILMYFLKAFDYSYASVQHGPLFSFAFYPVGDGIMNLPYAGTVAGTAVTMPEQGSALKSAKKYNTSAGYFYDIFQADFSYEFTIIRNQVFNNSGLGNDIPETEKTAYLLRLGKRFSDPGDSTYHLVYFGIKRIKSVSEYEDMEITALGYLVGYEGFYSFGIKYPLEFVSKFNTFIGTYRKEKFSSDIQFENTKKKNSITAGAELGIGFQYEPYDIAILFKFSYDFDQLAYRGELSGSDINFAYRMQAACFGFEIVYRMPNFKYNKR